MQYLYNTSGYTKTNAFCIMMWDPIEENLLNFNVYLEVSCTINAISFLLLSYFFYDGDRLYMNEIRFKNKLCISLAETYEKLE